MLNPVRGMKSLVAEVEDYFASLARLLDNPFPSAPETRTPSREIKPLSVLVEEARIMIKHIHASEEVTTCLNLALESAKKGKYRGHEGMLPLLEIAEERAERAGKPFNACVVRAIEKVYDAKVAIKGIRPSYYASRVYS